jgi:hypothetical protein
MRPSFLIGAPDKLGEEVPKRAEHPLRAAPVATEFLFDVSERSACPSSEKEGQRHQFPGFPVRHETNLAVLENFRGLGFHRRQFLSPTAVMIQAVGNNAGDEHDRKAGEKNGWIKGRWLPERVERALCDCEVREIAPVAGGP